MAESAGKTLSEGGTDAGQGAANPDSSGAHCADIHDCPLLSRLLRQTMGNRCLERCARRRLPPSLYGEAPEIVDRARVRLVEKWSELEVCSGTRRDCASTDLARLWAWLQTAVANLSTSVFRRSRVRDRWFQTRAQEAPDALIVITAPSPAVYEEVINSYLYVLPERQETAFRLRYLGQRTQVEVSQAMGITVAAARGLCDRARESLRNRIGCI